MTRAIIYARASTAEQDTSTAQQITAATAYAAAHGYTVAASFQDDAKVYAEWRRRRIAEIKAGQAGGDTARQTLARIEAQITRLTAAIEAGGNLPGLLAQLQRREAERAEAAAKLSAPAPAPPPIIDAAELCGRVRALLQARDPHALRLAVRAVVERVTVAGLDAVTVETVSPDRLSVL